MPACVSKTETLEEWILGVLNLNLLPVTVTMVETVTVTVLDMAKSQSY